ncbi:DHHC palmitoyltransferase-domain-containing protein [Dichotomocladium elegans]|nr:DHHC palmitoyltransferase-domain-containing protein [Dichotomocladium elegans]
MPRFWYVPGTLDSKTLRPSVEATEATALLPAVSISRMDGMPRYCETCRCYKPDRTHHCKECDTCILRMDHHCPWISGCVGHLNYKFFFLFVLYADVYAVWVFFSSTPQIVIVLNDENKASRAFLTSTVN